MDEQETKVEVKPDEGKPSNEKPKMNLKLVIGIAVGVLAAIIILVIALLSGGDGSDNTGKDGGISNPGENSGSQGESGSQDDGTQSGESQENPSDNAHVHNMVNDKCSICGSGYSKCLYFTSFGNGECSVRYSSYDPETNIELAHESDIIVPPTSPKGDKVTEVERYAFSHLDVVSITLPSTIEELCDSAFAEVPSLKTLALNEGLIKIGERIVSKSNVTSIEIPSTVTSIDEDAFFDCNSLVEIKVADGNSKYMDVDGNLYSKDGKTLLAYAVGKAEKQFEVPSGVTKIVEYAFNYSDNLTSVIIPKGVETIDRGAFYCCMALSEISVDSENANYKSVDGNLYTKDGFGLVQYAIGKTDKTFVVPDGVTQVLHYSFFYSQNLEKVVIPEGVTTISQGAFYGAKSLTEVVFPKTLTSLGLGAFQGCAKITDVYFAGSEAEWSAIDLGFNNSDIREANVHYNYKY